MDKGAFPVMLWLCGLQHLKAERPIPLVSSLTDIRKRFQGELFPKPAEEVGELQTKYRRLVAVLDVVAVEGFVGVCSRGSGRPAEDRAASARAFIAQGRMGFSDHAGLDGPRRVWARYPANRRFPAPLESSRGAGCPSGCARPWSRRRSRRRLSVTSHAIRPPLTLARSAKRR